LSGDLFDPKVGRVSFLTDASVKDAEGPPAVTAHANIRPGSCRNPAGRDFFTSCRSLVSGIKSLVLSTSDFDSSTPRAFSTRVRVSLVSGCKLLPVLGRRGNSVEEPRK